MNQQAAQEFLAPLAGDKNIFALQYDILRDHVLLVALEAEARAQASFLDERVLTPQTRGSWFPFSVVETALAAKSGAPHAYIFHMGHCGSTLISRLVAAATGAPALREPTPLRAFAIDQADARAGLLSGDALAKRLQVFEKIWARDGASAVVKATSICTGLFDRVAPAAQRIFLYQPPREHLAVLLAGDNALNDLRGFAQMRHRRLSALMELAPLSAFRLGELAALTWVAEAVAAIEHNAQCFSFPEFLQKPEEKLSDICAALGLAAPANQIAQATSGPIMRSYSKAPEHGYDGQLRARVINDALATHADEIRIGLQWMEKLGAQNEPARRALDGFVRAST